jgi:enoyl-CoA hydratase
MDLTELGTDRIPADSPNTFGRALRAVAKPVIGAINGPAITGGLEIALGCDFLIASDRAYFADTHAAVGVFPGGGMTVLLAEAVGLRRARQLSFTGAFVDAERAFRDGLVNEVMPHQELLPRARAVAAAIAEVDSDLLISLRASYRRGTNMFADNALRAEQAESAGRAISVVDVASVKDRVISLGARTLAAKDSMPEASPFSQPGF